MKLGWRERGRLGKCTSAEGNGREIKNVEQLWLAWLS